MKNFFKKIAGYLVTFYAECLYNKAVKEADAAHAIKNVRVYVVSGIKDVSKLLVMDRNEFRKWRRIYNLNGDLSQLKQGAWYYTPDGSGDCLAEQEKEIRRLAFIRHMLQRAKLA